MNATRPKNNATIQRAYSTGASLILLIRLGGYILSTLIFLLTDVISKGRDGS